jgi:hypothetical protein
MRTAGATTVTINAEDVLDFTNGGSTGESFNSNAIDLIVQGESGDTLNLNATGSHHFTFQGTMNMTDTGAYGSGTFNVYADDQGNYVAIAQEVTTVAN